MKQKLLMNGARALAFFGICILSSSAIHAQLSTDQNDAFGARQKVQVNLTIMPSVKEFKAGVTTADSSGAKLQLWVCNGQGKKCTISIATDQGFIWSGNFKDAYYRQVFDLSLLDDGEYKLRVTNGKDNFERKIILNSQTISSRNVSIQ